jgi:hypothetical protein
MQGFAYEFYAAGLEHGTDLGTSYAFPAAAAGCVDAVVGNMFLKRKGIGTIVGAFIGAFIQSYWEAIYTMQEDSKKLLLGHSP